jgi:hypothetical protein
MGIKILHFDDIKLLINIENDKMNKKEFKKKITSQFRGYLK